MQDELKEDKLLLKNGKGDTPTTNLEEEESAPVV